MSKPFKALLHGGDFGSLEYQPQSDYVECSGRGSMQQFIAEYEAQLLRSGVDRLAARKRAHGVVGAVVVLREQFAAVGLEGLERTTDRDSNRKRWELLVRNNSTLFGSTPGRTRARPERTAHARSAPVRQSHSASTLVDTIVERVEDFKSRRTTGGSKTE